MREVELVADLKLELGECPRWHAEEGVLYLVDIARRRLHRLDPESGELRTREFDQPVGCFGFRARGGFVLAMRDGFALLDDFDAPVRPFGPPVESDRPHTRFNDGRVDAQGRFWASTMDTSKQHRDATLYRLDPDGTVTAMDNGALTGNGAAFSADGRRFHFSDTPEHVIYAYDVDAERGKLSNKRDLRRFPFGQGRPDGGSFDAAGDYWCALYAGARVVRLSPGGELGEEVAIPAKNVTMPAFGGADGRTVYVTTARQGMTEEDAARYPLAGGVWRFRADAPGVAEHPFAG